MKKVIIKDKSTKNYIGVIEVFPEGVRELEKEFIVIESYK